MHFRAQVHIKIAPSKKKTFQSIGAHQKNAPSKNAFQIFCH